MRKLLLLPLFCGILMNCFSQQHQTRIDEYLLPAGNAAELSIVVDMPYGRHDIRNVSGDTSALRSAGDVMIDIICTDYPASASLEKLNQERLKQIFQLFPSLSEKNIRQISFLRQLNGSEREKATTMFHGAVIRYRPAQTKETMKKDLEKLEEMLASKTSGLTIPPPDFKSASKDSIGAIDEPPASASHKSDLTLSEFRSEIKATETSTLVHTDFTTSGKAGTKVWHGTMGGAEPEITKRDKHSFPKADSLSIMTSRDALKKGYLESSSYDKYFSEYPLVTVYFGPGPGIPSLLFGHIDDLDSLALVKDSLSASGYSLNPDYRLPDSTIFRVFERNKWKNVTVVGDVTGSMYPYTAQLLLWLKLHSLDDFTTQFAFFNDGDDTPDHKKKIGKTGGIYFKKCESFDEAKELVKSTMLKGGGGDCPENDIEALLLTEKEFPNNDFQVLIADNWAPIKDHSLIDKLTKPVRVVLCGANEYGVNVDYLNLARKTKGSVHLMEQDLTELASLHEGETIKIGRLNFRIVDGEFKPVADPEKTKSL